MSTAIGRAAPAFTAPSTDGDISLKNLKGRVVVMYFYPRDNTPGCTTEGQNFRDRYAEFQAAGAEILGVSRDTLASHQKFKEKQGFPFPLLADPDETLCELYGVMKMKNMYGKQVRGIERSTFLIDAQGKLRQEWRGVKVPGHVDAVLEAVRGLA
ncbi:peroxiredoxin [Pigmentiphaga sp. GD03639]|uniref:thioredoxin-dependent peroxiredoxin n=1 Tax=Pigmentiphaga daeguensis TaxID=414049 RepID=A0ABN1CYX8_9BURK|nr:peroxiredoxin [Pigmentiphaga sp. GD03639]MDH2235960.1 peroxiredoxin [Pigmentiphaga sp. GD03639]